MGGFFAPGGGVLPAPMISVHIQADGTIVPSFTNYSFCDQAVATGWVVTHIATGRYRITTSLAFQLLQTAPFWFIFPSPNPDTGAACTANQVPPTGSGQVEYKLYSGGVLTDMEHDVFVFPVFNAQV